MDLAMGIAGKAHKKYVRPNKVFADGSTADPDAHKANPGKMGELSNLSLPSAITYSIFA